MKRYIVICLLFFCQTIFFSCNTATPEKYFDVAVLNSNMFVGFADNGLLRQLESPSARMEENGKVIPMQRSEMIGSMIKYTEESLQKLKGLKETAETKEMLQTSRAMYEYVLSVYKKEYTELAVLYDSGAVKDKIEAQAKSIHDKHYAHYNEMYTKLISIGKSYAVKHDIKVNWGS